MSLKDGLFFKGPMPALCLVCEKRCDGQFYCSDECREQDQARIRDDDERAIAQHESDRDLNAKEVLDDFFSNI